MKRVLVLTIMCITFLGNVYARGGQSSAGGDGVIINGKPYLLDFVERNIHTKIYFKDSDHYYPEVAELFVEKIGVSENVGKLISAKLIEIFDKDSLIEFLIKWNAIRNIEWIFSPRDLINVKDEDLVLGFSKYELVQLAARQGSSIFIAEETWECLDDHNKVGLIFHEIFYYLQDLNGKRNTPNLRKIIANFFSSSISEMTKKDFVTFLRRSDFNLKGLLDRRPNGLFLDNMIYINKKLSDREYLKPTDIIYENFSGHDRKNLGSMYLFEELGGEFGVNLKMEGGSRDILDKGYGYNWSNVHILFIDQPKKLIPKNVCQDYLPSDLSLVHVEMIQYCNFWTKVLSKDFEVDYKIYEASDVF